MASAEPRVASVWAGVPRFVWAVTALHVLLLLVYTLLYPPFQNPDEPQHVDLTLAVYSGEAWPWPDPGERIYAEAIAHAQQYAAAPAHRYGTAAVDPRGERPSLAELGGLDPARPAPVFVNQLVQHPPLYYATGAVVLRALPDVVDDWSYDQVVAVLRLLSVAMLAPLPLLVWAGARLVLGATATARAAAVVPLAIPGLTRIGAAANNDNLLTLLTASLLLVCVTVALGDLRRRTAGWAALLLTLALLTKGFALVLPPVVAAAYLLGWRHRRRIVWPPAVLALGVPAVFGGWWWIRNLLRYGTVQPSGFGPYVDSVYPSRPPDLAADVGRFVDAFVTEIVDRFWSTLGLLDSPELPDAAITTAAAVLLVSLVLAFLVGVRRDEPRRPLLGLLVLPAPLILGVVVYGAWQFYVDYALLGGTQGRYFYPALVGLAVVALTGWGHVLGRWRVTLPLLVLLGALTMQVLAFDAIVGRFWLPEAAGLDWGLIDDALGDIARWSPWPRAVTLTPFVLVPLAAAVALVFAMARAVRPAVEPTASLPSLTHCDMS